MKFKFKLEKLLSYKLQMLNNEISNLAELRKELEENERILLKLKDNQVQYQREFEKKILEDSKPIVFQTYTTYLEELKEKRKKIDLTIEHIMGKMFEQVEIIKTIKLETKSLETLKNGRFDEYNKQELKKVELQIEEFVTTAKFISEQY
jgi:flagellar FliJ protein